MKEILLSIIVPMYNVQDYIHRCLESLLDQDIPEEQYEIILVDDGSRDKTLEYAQKIGERHGNIRIFSQENRGVSAARNYGIDMAQGKYIWFVDGDDYILGDCLGIILEKAMKNNMDILSFSYEVSEKNERIQSRGVHEGVEIEKVCTGTEYIGNYQYANMVWDSLFRTGYLKEKGLRFIEGRYCEDSMFKLEAVSYGERVAYLPLLAYIYFKNPLSIMNNHEKSHYEKMIEDYIFVGDFFSRFMEKIGKEREPLDKKYLQRVRTRRDSFIFFLLIRLIRSELNYSQIMEFYNALKGKGYLPLKNFIGKDYRGIEYRTLTWFFNSEGIFSPAVRLLKFKEKFWS